MVALFELGARRAAEAVRNGEPTAEPVMGAPTMRRTREPMRGCARLGKSLT
jgi:hypothetical protein